MATAWHEHGMDDDAIIGFILETTIPSVEAKIFSFTPSTRGLLTQEQLSEVLYTCTTGDVQTAVSQFLSLTEVRTYVQRIDSEDRRKRFERQCHTYLSIYQPRCKFRIVPTRQYDLNKAQYAIHTTKHIQRGETIDFLTGFCVEIPQDSAEALEVAGRAHSIMDLGRSRTTCLLLSILRFVNHDCNPNCCLNTASGRRHGVLSASMKAIRDIPPKTEITWSYGDEFFGSMNRFCECPTCKEQEPDESWLPYSSPSSWHEEIDESHIMSIADVDPDQQPLTEGAATTMDMGGDTDMPDSGNVTTTEQEIEEQESLLNAHELSVASIELLDIAKESPVMGAASSEASTSEYQEIEDISDEISPSSAPSPPPRPKPRYRRIIFLPAWQ